MENGQCISTDKRQKFHIKSSYSHYSAIFDHSGPKLTLILPLDLNFGKFTVFKILFKVVHHMPPPMADRVKHKLECIEDFFINDVNTDNQSPLNYDSFHGGGVYDPKFIKARNDYIFR